MDVSKQTLLPTHENCNGKIIRLTPLIRFR